MTAHPYWRLNITADAGAFGGGNHFCNIAEILFWDKNAVAIATTGGTAFDSGNFGGNGPANAFDGNVGTVWSGNTNGLYGPGPNPVYIGYQFTTPKEVVYAQVQGSSSSGPSAFNLEHSDDGVTYTSDGGVTGYPSGTGWPAHGTTPPAAVNDTTPRRYWRYFQTRAKTTQEPDAAEIEWRATPGGSNQTGSGTATASSSLGGFPASNAYDGNPATFWVSNTTSWMTSWIGYDFGAGTPVTVNEFYLKVRNDGFAVNEGSVDFIIQGSDDAVTWDLYWSEWGLADWSAGEARTFTNPAYVAPTVDTVGAAVGAATVSGVTSNVTGFDVSQLVMEVASPADPAPLDVSQLVMEAAAAIPASPLDVSQLVMEVVSDNHNIIDTVGSAYGVGDAEAVSTSSNSMVGSAVGTASADGPTITVENMVGSAAGHATVSGVTSAFQPTPGLWPPAGNTAIQHTIGSYLYVQYNDDDNLQSLVRAYNAYTQGYLTWFNNIYLPVYTNGTITGSLLDWVAAGLYGLSRPGLPTQGVAAKGPFNTWALNTLAFNQQTPAVSQTYYATTDDTFKRILTWLTYKDDGRQFTVRWLKRRIARFLEGINGTSFNIDETYAISVTFTGDHEVTIEVPDGSQAVILQAAIDAGVLELPFQYTWIVNLV